MGIYLTNADFFFQKSEGFVNAALPLTICSMFGLVFFTCLVNYKSLVIVSSKTISKCFHCLETLTKFHRLYLSCVVGSPVASFKLLIFSGVICMKIVSNFSQKTFCAVQTSWIKPIS